MCAQPSSEELASFRSVDGSLRIEPRVHVSGSPRVEPLRRNDPAIIPRRLDAPQVGFGLSRSSISTSVKDSLSKLPPGRFGFSSIFPDLSSALTSGSWWLDLFSGSRGLAKEIVRASPCWVLCYDLSHGRDEDMLNVDVQAEVLQIVNSGPRSECRPCLLSLLASHRTCLAGRCKP